MLDFDQYNLFFSLLQENIEREKQKTKNYCHSNLSEISETRKKHEALKERRTDVKWRLGTGTHECNQVNWKPKLAKARSHICYAPPSRPSPQHRLWTFNTLWTQLFAIESAMPKALTFAKWEGEDETEAATWENLGFDKAHVLQLLARGRHEVTPEELFQNRCRWWMNDLDECVMYLLDAPFGCKAFVTMDLL